MNVTQFLQNKGVAFDVLPHRDTYDAQHLAQELHVPGKFVAKTVLLRADRGYRYILAVVPAPNRIDLAKASSALGGSRLELAAEHELPEHCPDCDVGVLPPFGSQYGMRTLVDSSLTGDEWIVFEGNTHCEAIRMRFADFKRMESPLIAPIAHGAHRSPMAPIDRDRGIRRRTERHAPNA